MKLIPMYQLTTRRMVIAVTMLLLAGQVQAQVLIHEANVIVHSNDTGSMPPFDSSGSPSCCETATQKCTDYCNGSNSSVSSCAWYAPKNEGGTRRENSVCTCANGDTNNFSNALCVGPDYSAENGACCYNAFTSCSDFCYSETNDDAVAVCNWNSDPEEDGSCKCLGGSNPTKNIASSSCTLSKTARHITVARKAPSDAVANTRGE